MEWIETLCVWDGIVRAVKDPVGGEVTVDWDGCWVANENSPNAFDVPEVHRNAFSRLCDGELEFRVKGSAQPVKIHAMEPMNDRFLFQPFTANLTSGEGYDWKDQKHQDVEHEVRFMRLRWAGSSDKRTSLCFAKGSNEYGKFISVGWMRPGNRLTLARRYVADDRKHWTLDTLQQMILNEIYDERKDSVVMPPWKCYTMNTKYQIVVDYSGQT